MVGADAGVAGDGTLAGAAGWITRVRDATASENYGYLDMGRTLHAPPPAGCQSGDENVPWWRADDLTSAPQYLAVIGAALLAMAVLAIGILAGRSNAAARVRAAGWRLLSPARFSWWSSGGAPCRNDLIVIESQTASRDGRSPSGLWRLSRTYGNLIANVRAAAPAGCVSLTIALARATASGRKLARIIIRRPVCRRRVDALMSRPRDRRP